MLPRVFAFVALFVTPCVHDNVNKDKKTQRHEQEHARFVFPDLLDAIRQLGPIHAVLKYTDCHKNKIQQENWK